MKERYKQLLTYVKDAVTRNKSEKSINSILDYISTSQQVNYLRLHHPPPHTHTHTHTQTTRHTMYSLSTHTHTLFQADLLQWFYETTLEALQDAKNDRLWFKTNTKVTGNVYTNSCIMPLSSLNSIVM